MTLRFFGRFQRLNLISGENQCALLAFTNGLVVEANGFSSLHVDGT
jgi:hypothetical protein